jgi:hypothetical protein
MDEQEVRTWRFLGRLAPPLIILGLLLYLIGTITLASLIVAVIGLSAVFIGARWKLSHRS